MKRQPDKPPYLFEKGREGQAIKTCPIVEGDLLTDHVVQTARDVVEEIQQAEGLAGAGFSDYAVCNKFPDVSCGVRESGSNVVIRSLRNRDMSEPVVEGAVLGHVHRHHDWVGTANRTEQHF